MTYIQEWKKFLGMFGKKNFWECFWVFDLNTLWINVVWTNSTNIIKYLNLLPLPTWILISTIHTYSWEISISKNMIWLTNRIKIWNFWVTIT